MAESYLAVVDGDSLGVLDDNVYDVFLLAEKKGIVEDPRAQYGYRSIGGLGNGDEGLKEMIRNYFIGRSVRGWCSVTRAKVVDLEGSFSLMEKLREDYGGVVAAIYTPCSL